MLRACRDLLRPGGRLAFFTIHPAPDLTEAAYRRACRLGPRAVATRRRDHLEMLATAGFEAIESIDLTPEFRRAAADLLACEAEHEDALRAAVGDRLFDERRASVEETLCGIDERLLRRSLFLARRPDRSS
ncbi:MAG: hypothetical protein R3244_13325 [Thermoanaerobaculia bacterium]|nr:hypothetical protein [Thermoanaerobaculia bacterium]